MNGKFIISLALPGHFCIIIGDGTVQCYRSRDKVLVFLIFHLGKALASWKFYEFLVNFPSSSLNSNLGKSWATCFDFRINRPEIILDILGYLGKH